MSFFFLVFNNMFLAASYWAKHKRMLSAASHVKNKLDKDYANVVLKFAYIPKEQENLGMMAPVFFCPLLLHPL